jgi:hypothetical protein
VTDGFTSCDKVKGWVEGELGRNGIDVAGDAKGTRNVQERANGRRAMYNYATNMRELSTSRSRFDS